MSLEHFVVNNNIVERGAFAGDFGISLSWARYGTCNGNTVRNFNFINIEPAGTDWVTYNGNTIDGTGGGYGFLGSDNLTNNNFGHNTVRNVGTGIELYGLNGPGGRTNQAIGNSINDNTFVNGSFRGIFLNQLGANANFQVSNNTVTGYTGSGIYIHLTDGGIVEGNISQGNNPSNVPQEGNYYYNNGGATTNDRINRWNYNEGAFMDRALTVVAPGPNAYNEAARFDVAGSNSPFITVAGGAGPGGYLLWDRPSGKMWMGVHGGIHGLAALSDGTAEVSGRAFGIRTGFTPTSTADPAGRVGDVSRDDNFIYLKTSIGWKRAALSTW